MMTTKATGGDTRNENAMHTAISTTMLNPRTVSIMRCDFFAGAGAVKLTSTPNSAVASARLTALVVLQPSHTERHTRPGCR